MVLNESLLIQRGCTFISVKMGGGRFNAKKNCVGLEFGVSYGDVGLFLSLAHLYYR